MRRAPNATLALAAVLVLGRAAHAAPAPAPRPAPRGGEVIETEAFGRAVRIPGPPGMINLLTRMPPGAAGSHADSEVRAIFVPDSVWRASGEGRRPIPRDLFVVAAVPRQAGADDQANAQGILSAQSGWAEGARRSTDPRRARALEALRRAEKGGDGRIQPPLVFRSGEGFPLEVETRDTRAVTLLSVQRQAPGEGPGECAASALVLVRGRVVRLMYARHVPATARTAIEVRSAMRRWVDAVLAAN